MADRATGCVLIFHCCRPRFCSVDANLERKSCCYSTETFSGESPKFVHLRRRLSFGSCTIFTLANHFRFQFLVSGGGRRPRSLHFPCRRLGESSALAECQHLPCDASQQDENQFPAFCENGSVGNEQFEKHLFCSLVPVHFGEFRRATIHLCGELVYLVERIHQLLVASRTRQHSCHTLASALVASVVGWQSWCAVRRPEPARVCFPNIGRWPAALLLPAAPSRPRRTCCEKFHPGLVVANVDCPMDLAYMCVKPQMRLYVCQALPLPNTNAFTCVSPNAFICVSPNAFICVSPNAFICVSPNAFLCVSPNASAESATELASLADLCSLRSHIFSTV